MRFVIIAATSLVLLPATAIVPHALAQSASQGLPLSGAGDQPPGGLTARDVVGKRLSDADGNVIGQIVGVSRDGASAEVRPPHGGGLTNVDMSELSLGTGARQVILGGEPAAPPPHWSSHSTSVTSTTTAPSVVVLPPPPQ
ncbi:MAG TPA: hypothetical protein VKQ29_18285 [Aliidongia sp.]|nr:hypothetical protein [Aliidongia sp.]